MDRYRRTSSRAWRLPASKLIQRKREKEWFAKYRKRLRSVKKSIDMSSPKCSLMAHKKCNRNKAKQMKDRHEMILKVCMLAQILFCAIRD